MKTEITYASGPFASLVLTLDNGLSMLAEVIVEFDPCVCSYATLHMENNDSFDMDDYLSEDEKDQWCSLTYEGDRTFYDDEFISFCKMIGERYLAACNANRLKLASDHVYCQAETTGPGEA